MELGKFVPGKVLALLLIVTKKSMKKVRI